LNENRYVQNIQPRLTDHKDSGNIDGYACFTVFMPRKSAQGEGERIPASVESWRS
jgi:hypothetical protein